MGAIVEGLARGWQFDELQQAREVGS